MHLFQLRNVDLAITKWPLTLACLYFGCSAWADSLIASNILLVTFQNQAATISALTNDFDATSNQMAILQVSAPVHGTAVINSNAPVTTPELSHLFQFCELQLSNTVRQMPNTNTYPRSTQTNGTWKTVNNSDWTCGFFPGGLWYLYERSGVQILKHGRSGGQPA